MREATFQDLALQHQSYLIQEKQNREKSAFSVFLLPAECFLSKDYLPRVCCVACTGQSGLVPPGFGLLSDV